MKSKDSTIRLAENKTPRRIEPACNVIAQRDDTWLPSQLLPRMDENLTCRRLLDNDSLDIDLSSTLLSQLAATSQIERALAELEAEGHPWAPRLSAVVDAAFENLVRIEAVRPPVLRDPAAQGPAGRIVECLAAAVGSLTQRVGRNQEPVDPRRDIVGT